MTVGKCRHCEKLVDGKYVDDDACPHCHEPGWDARQGESDTDPAYDGFTDWSGGGDLTGVGSPMGTLATGQYADGAIEGEYCTCTAPESCTRQHAPSRLSDAPVTT